MDHVNVNRVALSALGAVLFVMLLTAFSNLLLSPRTPKVPGFALPTSGPATEAAAGPAEPEAPPLPVLLAKADATKGAQLAKVCQTCHNFEKGAAAKIGPPLWGVVGRPIASIPGFAYSDSLKAVGGNWTYEALNVMVSNPKKEAAGTKMTFPGEKDPQRRADILAYLQTLSELAGPVPEIGAGRQPRGHRGAPATQLPIPFHADNSNAVIPSLIERLGQRAQSELAVVGRLPLRVVMAKKQRKAGSRARLCVTHHWKIAVGIAERQQGPPADMQADA